MSRSRYELNQPPPSIEGQNEVARLHAQHVARNKAWRQEEADQRGEELLKANDAAKEQEGRYIEHGPELLAACREQHVAIDALMARLIPLDPNFYPTRSEVWPAVCHAVAVMAKVEGR